MKERLCVGVLILSLSVLALGQQVPVYSLQESVRPGMNPAYVGNEAIPDFMVLSRQQWLGFEGAPRSYFIASNVPLRNPATGVGVDLQLTSSGPYTQSGLFGSYSYSTQLTEEAHISFGLRGGMHIFQTSIASLQTIDALDPLITDAAATILRPNFGAGIHLRYRDYFLDLSVPMFLQNELRRLNQDPVGEGNLTSRTYMASIGGRFELDESWTLYPSITAWMIQSAPSLIDLRVSVQLQEILKMGLAYRLTGGLALYFELLALKDFTLCYAYELPLAYDYHVSTGTHEIALGMNFQFLKSKTMSPRRF